MSKDSVSLPDRTADADPPLQRADEVSSVSDPSRTLAFNPQSLSVYGDKL